MIYKNLKRQTSKSKINSNSQLQTGILLLGFWIYFDVWILSLGFRILFVEN